MRGISRYSRWALQMVQDARDLVHLDTEVHHEDEKHGEQRQRSNFNEAEWGWRRGAILGA